MTSRIARFLIALVIAFDCILWSFNRDTDLTPVVGMGVVAILLWSTEERFQ